MLIQPISSIHKLILIIQQILGPHELYGYTALELSHHECRIALNFQKFKVKVVNPFMVIRQVFFLQ